MYKDKLKSLRENYGIKQKELALLLNIDRSQYGKYENEYAIIPLIHLNTLANYYNVSLDYLFDFNNNINYPNSINKIDILKCKTRLKEFRKNNKLTQVKLATILNTVQPVIANYEKGKHLIATPFLYTICKKYNISADYLLGKIDKPSKI